MPSSLPGLLSVLSLGHFLFLPGSLPTPASVTFCVTHWNTYYYCWVTVYNQLGHFLYHSRDTSYSSLGHCLQPPGSLSVSLTETLTIPAWVTIYNHLGHFLYHSRDTSYSCPGHCLQLPGSLSVSFTGTLPIPAQVTVNRCVGYCLALPGSLSLSLIYPQLGHCLLLPGSLSTPASTTAYRLRPTNYTSVWVTVLAWVRVCVTGWVIT